MKDHSLQGLKGAARAFRRRTYRGLADFRGDMRFMIGNRSLVKRAMRSGEISPGFRERLMMVVTEVNGCRYCSYYHSARSIKAGLSNEELRSLLSGQIPEDSPAEEIPALVYAQHWPRPTRNLISKRFTTWSRPTSMKKQP